jgi:hypothetical protein
MAQNTVEKPQDWMALQGSLAAPSAAKVQSYNRDFLGIVSSTQAEVLRAAQLESGAYVRRVQALVVDVTKNAPAGSGAAMAALNSTISAASTFYQSLGKTGQQAVEVARSNLDVAVAVASKSARRAIEQEQQAARR